jgi:hypothetical protein
MANMSTSSMNFGSSACVSWTFRKQPKFFDVVSWTGNATNRTIAHALGSIPGSIWVKRTDANSAWQVYHRSLANTEYLVLNTTAAVATNANRWNSTTPTSTVFSLGTDATVNASGGTYVAYIFAHDAGGFGLAGTDNVISCGSYTGVTYPNSLEVTIGFEPQFVIIKNSNTESGWTMWDIMRGMSVVPAANTAQALLLEPNTSDAESNQPGIFPTATGFVVKNGLTSISSPSDKMIYIAIRRPMKVPTTGTSVFAPVAATPSGGQDTVTTNFPTDLIITTERSHSSTGQTFVSDRLRGTTTATRKYLNTAGTAAEAGGAGGFGLDSNVAIFDNFYQGAGITNPVIYWNFRRASSFFDEVCYTGTGSATTFSHNLQAVPELMIVKNRGTAVAWKVYHSAIGNTKFLELNDTAGSTTASTIWNDTTPTSSVFTVGSGVSVNQSGVEQVAYLFATCAGVSKVFSYTGNGSSQTINCGFTGGARFVLIKRTDASGGWYVWDTARGIVSGNDPHLRLNSTAAEVTTDDTIDTDSTGFVVNQVSATDVNVSSATYIGLAIA